MNPYQGLKHYGDIAVRLKSEVVPINLNPYQGLKLKPNQSAYIPVGVPINLNPYQGLKQSIKEVQNLYDQVPINLNPYQGLKQVVSKSDRTSTTAFQLT